MSDCRCSVSVILLHSWILFIVRDSFFPAIQLKFSLTWLPPITPNYRLIKPLDYCEQFSSLPSPTSTFLQKFPEPITGLYWMSGNWNPQVYSMELWSGVWGCMLKALSLFLVILLTPNFQKVPTIKGYVSWRLPGTKRKAQLWICGGCLRAKFQWKGIMFWISEPSRSASSPAHLQTLAEGPLFDTYWRALLFLTPERIQFTLDSLASP